MEKENIAFTGFISVANNLPKENDIVLVSVYHRPMYPRVATFKGGEFIDNNDGLKLFPLYWRKYETK